VCQTQRPATTPNKAKARLTRRTHKKGATEEIGRATDKLIWLLLDLIRPGSRAESFRIRIY
jgi:hypothetical protein